MPGSEILPADAVRLLDELTAIVARACAGNSRDLAGHRVERHQARPVAGHRRRRGLGSDHPGGPGAAAAGRAGGLRGTAGRRAGRGPRPEFPPRRSARRHARVHRRPRRVHRQSRHRRPAACRSPASSRRRRSGQVWRGVVGAQRRAAAACSARRRRSTRGAIHTRPLAGRTAAVAAVSRSHLDSATDAFLATLGPVDASAPAARR